MHAGSTSRCAGKSRRSSLAFGAVLADDFVLESGRVRRIVEFWPEPYPAPANRAHLVEIME